MYREADKTVYELYDSFVQRVLVDKKDFFDDSDDLLLTKENLEECKKRFIENYDEDKDRNFSEKAKGQFEGASEPVQRLFAHAIWLWGFSVNESKNSDLIFIENTKKPQYGFANSGQHHLTNKFGEVSFCIRLFDAILEKSIETVEEVKAYLINVNTSARIFQKNGFTPETLCNQGGFIENDVKQFEDPGIITNEIKGSVGSQTVYPDIVFRCYPNECEEESAGSPFTRLVIEGKINGNTCFYPIDINRGQPSGKGIGRNCRYIYNITIKSSGSSDPDTAVTPADVDITCGIVPWDESDNDEIIF